MNRRIKSHLTRPGRILWSLIFALGFVPAKELIGQPYGLNSRPAGGIFLNHHLPEVPPPVGNYQAVVAFSNLNFYYALGLTYVPGTNRLCVWEREGRVYTFAADPGKVNTIKVVGFEKGGITAELKDRPAVRYDVDTQREEIAPRAQPAAAEGTTK